MQLRNWIKKHGNNIARIGLIVFFLILAIWAITLGRYHLVIGNSEISLWLTAALVSVGPELAGIVIGVVTIDYLNERRQDNQLKKQLILQMASRHNDVTDIAWRTMASYGWLRDGSLRKANLTGADLTGADLTGADLTGANLLATNLTEARLAGVYLDGTCLTGAKLIRSDMVGAKLTWADLAWADLTGADLTGTYLSRANLTGATGWTEKQLLRAEVLNEATMPDGRNYEEWIQGIEREVYEHVVAEILNATTFETVSEEE